MDIIKIKFIRFKFEAWAKKEEFDINKYPFAKDHTGLPAYESSDTGYAWSGFYAAYSKYCIEPKEIET